MSDTIVLDGTCALISKIDGDCTMRSVLDGVIEKIFHVSNHREYEGEYEVTPSSSQQVLETKHKLMADDVTVREIPYYQTSNESGGYTIYIGGSVYVD